MHRSLYIRLRNISSINLFYRGRKSLYIVDPPSCHAQRLHKHPEISVDGYEITHGNLPFDHHPASHQHQNDSQQIRQQLKQRNISAPDPCSPQLRLAVTVIFHRELLHLIIFLGKRLDHAVAADIFLHICIQAGECLTALSKCRVYVFGLAPCGKRRQWQHRKHTNCKLPVCHKDHQQCKDKI